MQQQWPSDDHPPRRLAQRLNRMLGEINVFLLAVAIGLAVLDFTGFVALGASTEMARAQQSMILVMPAPSAAPSIASR